MATFRGAVKVTTNLTGLTVSPKAPVMLGAVYSKTLRALAKMPQDYAYRKHTEQIVKERASLVKSTADIAELEKKIGCGQIEEILIQAENELHLARNILAWKSWEPLQTQPEPTQWKWPM